MESYAAPFRALASASGWFARAPEIRLFNVVTSPALREAAIDVVMAQEYHADNRSPFVRLEAPWTTGDTGWEERSKALREQHEKRRTAFAKEGIALPPLTSASPTRASETQSDPAVRFA